MSWRERTRRWPAPETSEVRYSTSSACNEMRSFVDIQHELDLVRFLESENGDLYVPRASDGPQISFREERFVVLDLKPTANELERFAALVDPRP